MRVPGAAVLVQQCWCRGEAELSHPVGHQGLLGYFAGENQFPCASPQGTHSARALGLQQQESPSVPVFHSPITAAARLLFWQLDAENREIREVEGRGAEREWGGEAPAPGYALSVRCCARREGRARAAAAVVQQSLQE